MYLAFLLGCETSSQGSAASATGEHRTTESEETSESCLVEVCNGVDDDGDGEVDEGLLRYTDADGDGYGTGLAACDGEAVVGTDCDDANPTIHPDAEDIRFDEIDQDCDGADRDCSDAGAVWKGDFALGVGTYDWFCEQYGTVEGNLEVREFEGESLAPVPCLCEVTGDVHIADNASLLSLDGLDGLSRVGGGFDIYRNASLLSLRGLGRLQVAASLQLVDLPQLESVDGLGGLRSVSALTISDVERLTSLGGFARLSHLDSVRLTGNDSLVDVSPLSVLGADIGEAFIDRNPGVADVAFLSAVRTAERIYLRENGISSIAPLALEEVDNLSILEPGVSDLEALATLRTVGDLDLAYLAVTTLAPLGGLGSVERLSIDDCDALGDLTGLSGVTIVQAVYIRDCDALVDLHGLEGAIGNGETSTVSLVAILGNDGLNSLDGLGAVRWLDDLYIADNTMLADIGGLSSLTNVDKYLGIEDNPYVRTSVAEALCERFQPWNGCSVDGNGDG